MEYLDRLIEAARSKLVRDFDEWYNEQYPAAPEEGESTRGLTEAQRREKAEAEQALLEDPESLAFFNARRALQSKPGVRYSR